MNAFDWFVVLFLPSFALLLAGVPTITVIVALLAVVAIIWHLMDIRFDHLIVVFVAPSMARLIGVRDV